MVDGETGAMGWRSTLANGIDRADRARYNPHLTRRIALTRDGPQVEPFARFPSSLSRPHRSQGVSCVHQDVSQSVIADRSRSV